MGGWKTAHHMHEINVYRCLFFGMKCGTNGSCKPKKLTAACLPPQPVRQGGFRVGTRVIDRIRSGKLPAGAKTWPDEMSKQRRAKEAYG